MLIAEGGNLVEIKVGAREHYVLGGSPTEARQRSKVALGLFEASSCGFADCLVVAKHARQGCDFTATFDRGMRKLPGVKVL